MKRYSVNFQMAWLNSKIIRHTTLRDYEGVVVRIDNREKFIAYKYKNFSFKILEGIIKDNADASDMEEAGELVVNE